MQICSARARALFLEVRAAELSREPGWVLSDGRIVALHDCPETGPHDRLQVLFELEYPGPIASRVDTSSDAQRYRTELWFFHRVGGDWQVATDALANPSATLILDLNGARYDEVRNCNKVY